MPSNWKAWIEKALEDERIADLAASAGLWSGAGYHLQQAAEKRLKAVVARRGGRPRKTHDLSELATEIGIEPNEELNEILERLTALAWRTRYPGWDLSEDEFNDRRVDHAKFVAWLDSLP